MSEQHEDGLVQDLELALENAEARAERAERERDDWKRTAESQNNQWSQKCTELTEERAAREKAEQDLATDRAIWAALLRAMTKGLKDQSSGESYTPAVRELIAAALMSQNPRATLPQRDLSWDLERAALAVAKEREGKSETASESRAPNDRVAALERELEKQREATHEWRETAEMAERERDEALARLEKWRTAERCGIWASETTWDLGEQTHVLVARVPEGEE